jgi:splicing factor 3A subunit 3
MDSIIEQQRQIHEELERLEQAIVDEYLKEPKTPKERLVREHRVNEYLERIQQRARILQQWYTDRDGARATEIATMTGADEFSEFYQRLRTVKDYHRRNPNQTVEPLELEFQQRDWDKDAEGKQAYYMISSIRCLLMNVYIVVGISN